MVVIGGRLVDTCSCIKIMPGGRSMAGMMDPVVLVQEHILSAKLSICRTFNSTSSKKEEKLSCLTNQLNVLIELETELKSLDRQYANDPGKALAEKSKLYRRKNPGGC